jgi:hypothetical protein
LADVSRRIQKIPARLMPSFATFRLPRAECAFATSIFAGSLADATFFALENHRASDVIVMLDI